MFFEKNLQKVEPSLKSFGFLGNFQKAFKKRFSFYCFLRRFYDA